MDNLAITPGSLVEVLKVLTQGLLTTNLCSKISNFAKIDYKLLEHEQHQHQQSFLVQVTKCGLGCTDLTLKLLLDNAITNNTDHRGLRDTIVAVVEKKTGSQVKVKKAIYTCKSSLILRTVKIAITRKEFSVFKSYTCIKLLFSLAKNDLAEFSSLLEAHLRHVQNDYPKVKFVYRNNAEYFYRNLVPMDDILLSCNLVSSSLLNMFRNCRKNNPAHYENLKKLLGIRKSGTFEKTVTCVLISKADGIFMNSEGI